MLLTDLCRARGISGYEGEVRNVLKKHLEPVVDHIAVDSLGNLICTKSGSDTGNDYRVMVAAHMDEVGFMVTHIESSGLLGFSNVGGMDVRMLPSLRVRVGTGSIPGVIGTKPIHLEDPAARNRVISAEQLFIDIGAQDRDQASRHASPGDTVTFDVEPEQWGSEVFKGRALDDRVGCAVLADILASERYPFTLYGVFTVQEEIGLRGASVAAYSVDPHMGVALEGTTCADIPGSPEHGQATRMGKGTAISLLDRTSISNPAMVAELIRLAEENDVPYQFRQTAFGGNDAGKMAVSRAGAHTTVLSIPCRYIHAPAALCALSDMRATRKLLDLFLKSVGKGFRP